MSERESKKIGLNSDGISLVIAICAILISAASFDATYLQANLAERQVREMTLPLIQFVHSNYDEELNERAITFTLTNAGVGPAVIRNLDFIVSDTTHDSIWNYFGACCESEYEEFEVFQERLESQDEVDIFDGGMVTRPLNNVVIPGQSNHMFMPLYRSDSNAPFWEKLNQERWRVDLSMCYCSLLDECFEYDTRSTVTEVSSCPAN